MLRKFLLPAIALATLGGCVTGYGYRAGSGDYYYGQPEVEYRYLGGYSPHLRSGYYGNGFFVGLGYGYPYAGYGAWGRPYYGYPHIYGYPYSYWYRPRPHHPHGPGHGDDEDGDQGGHDGHGHGPGQDGRDRGNQPPWRNFGDIPPRHHDGLEDGRRRHGGVRPMQRGADAPRVERGGVVMPRQQTTRASVVPRTPTTRPVPRSAPREAPRRAVPRAGTDRRSDRE